MAGDECGAGVSPLSLGLGPLRSAPYPLSCALAAPAFLRTAGVGSPHTGRSSGGKAPPWEPLPMLPGLGSF